VVPISPVAHYDVRDLMRLGASAYLLKSASVEHLVGTIRAAVFGPEGENVIVGMPLRMLEEAPKGAGELLTVREMEIVLLAARGLSNRQIASSLMLAESTVKRHLANAYPKMGVSSRGEAARKALLEEWITIQDITHEEEE
jgi:DNA-binding NarL/FixJ family response regulator